MHLNIYFCSKFGTYLYEWEQNVVIFPTVLLSLINIFLIISALITVLYSAFHYAVVLPLVWVPQYHKQLISQLRLSWLIFFPGYTLVIPICKIFFLSVASQYSQLFEQLLTSFYISPLFSTVYNSSKQHTGLVFLYRYGIISQTELLLFTVQNKMIMNTALH